MDLKTESKITPLWLQCHLWVEALKVVQISLLLLDAAFRPPGINLLEVPKLWVVNRCWTNQHLGCRGWSACLFMYLSLAVQYLPTGCSVKHTMLITKHACWALLAKCPGELSQCNPHKWIPGQGREWIKGHLISCNSPTTKKLKQNPSGGERCDAAPPQVAELRDNNPQRMVEISCKNMSPQCINLEGYGWRLSTPKATQTQVTQQLIVRVYYDDWTQFRQFNKWTMNKWVDDDTYKWAMMMKW